jgi:hypothetical protein
MCKSSSKPSTCMSLISKTNIIKHVTYYTDVQQTAKRYESGMKKWWLEMKQQNTTLYIFRSKRQTLMITDKSYYDRHSICSSVSIPGYELNTENNIDPMKHSICRLHSYFNLQFTSGRHVPLVDWCVPAAVSYEIWGWAAKFKKYERRSIIKCDTII